MVDIRPFRGHLYNPEKFPDLSPVIAPPYDVMSNEFARHLQEDNPYNVSTLTVPDENASENTGDAYEKVAERWNRWQETGILVRRDQPGVWRIREEFLSTGGRLNRTGFVALLRLEDYSPEGVRRHERTHEAFERDRLRLLRKSGVSAGPILFIYPDKPDDIASLERSFVSDFETSTAGPDNDGVVIHVSHTADRPWIERFRSMMRPRPVIIADGHHRYAASLSLSRNVVDHSYVDAGWVMGLFLPASSPGLIIRPIHRAIRNVRNLDFARFEERLRQFFDPAPQGSPSPTSRSVTLIYETHDPVTLVPKEEIVRRLETEIKPSLAASLSPVLVDRIILDRVLKLSTSEIARQKILSYFHEQDTCVKAVRGGEYQMAFLVKSINAADLLAVTAEGGILPQKSTYFYPKFPDGLVMHSLRAR